MVRFVEAVTPLLIDLAAVAGIGLIVYGLAMIYPPAAFIASGFGLVGAAVFGARR